jgi:hypothetical protein
MQLYQRIMCQTGMRKLSLLLLGVLPFLSCDKESNGGVGLVEIYLLKSSSLVPGQCAVNPATAVLETTAFISNDEIISYNKSSYQFELSASAAQKMQTLQLRAPFAVTVNKDVIYYGIHMPMTMSSSCDNSITMSAVSNQLWVRLGYPGLMAGVFIDDQRNNARLITSLANQGKLR